MQNTNKKIISLSGSEAFDNVKEIKRIRHSSWRDLFYWKAIKGILTAGIGGLIFLIISYIAIFLYKTSVIHAKDDVTIARMHDIIVNSSGWILFVISFFWNKIKEKKADKNEE